MAKEWVAGVRYDGKRDLRPHENAPCKGQLLAEQNYEFI